MMRTGGLWKVVAGSLLGAWLVVSGLTPAQARSYARYVEGDPQAPTPGPVSGGLLLLGGGERDAEAMKWFFGKAGNGHIVVLRASYAGEVGKEFYRKVGGVRSVETFVFKDREAAFDSALLERLRRADGIFIAGGDQSNYVRFWKGTPVAELLDAHVAAGKPLGGTSAGLAMLGEYVYGAMDGGSLASPAALADPYGPANTIVDDFLHLAALKGVVTDTHFKERDRLGRLFAFVAKAQTLRDAKAQPLREAAAPPLLGLGVDEDTAVAVEADGRARVIAGRPGSGAWVVQGDGLRRRDRGGDLGTALQAPRVAVTVLDEKSVLHLPSGAVEAPAARQTYMATNGRLVAVPRWSLAIHGGAGVIERAALSPEREQAYRAGLDEALRAGGAVLEQGGKALEAVEAAARVLEDNPLFNAGRGAVFTAEGRNELDAAIMDGATLKAGAVAGVTRTRHPVTLARTVMAQTRHVMLAGPGADAFSREQGLEQVDPAWFRTEARWQQFQAWKAQSAAAVDRTHLFGTIGAVAVDAEGNLAAATSTGGMTGKKWGRIGDSPIIGAGTYAYNGRCAVSATGSGEYFIRESAARQVCDRVAWRGETLEAAAKATIMAVGAIGGDGGLIAIGPDGQATFAINDLGMYRGRMSADTPPQTAIFADEAFAGEPGAR